MNKNRYGASEIRRRSVGDLEPQSLEKLEKTWLEASWARQLEKTRPEEPRGASRTRSRGTLGADLGATWGRFGAKAKICKTCSVDLFATCISTLGYDIVRMMFRFLAISLGFALISPQETPLIRLFICVPLSIKWFAVISRVVGSILLC